MHRSLARCTSCRVSLLEAFTSLAGISVPAQAATSRFARPQAQSTRQFSQISPLRQSLEPRDSSNEALPPPPSTSSNTTESVPWYLQLEEPLPPTPISPLLALQEIPPLPLNPPTLLSPILTHLSTQIGLDNLTLLDLRAMDPPPALGTNLLMIIGTARSVKHLNVSADRFCRWARKEFKLRPYADGLLGRNELKLKLRRKARRMKLAQSVGNTSAVSSDDGITTGWVCVNLGAIEEPVAEDMDEQEGDKEEVVEQMELEVEAANKLRRKAQETPEEGEDEYHNPPEEEYVGFGSRTNSPRIVVQMFTEEKRVEMDLEGLWDVRNTRRARKGEKATAMAEAAIQMLEAEQEGEQDIEEKDGEDDSAKRKERGGETKIEEELEDEEAREDEGEEKPLGSIGAS
ncbi:ATPase synthesis protein 25 mitochondrial [Cladophialophora chaetospira]|uniref:ATPase synthesis protein 25 n=1 Tax=Cladophialophora chaetospira TaxID=386627 RepID=A0AA38XHU6_9EURO|nr:ATPase synthesis protein 25 mitochondrial [Cladophialophora chaetospira]